LIYIAHPTFTGWFTTFFKDAVDPEDNFDSRPGANLFIKHVKQESVPDATVASVTPSQEASHAVDTITEQTDTESVRFEDMIIEEESDDNGEVDHKQVDSEEEELKKRYEEEGGGGAGDADDDGGGEGADGETTTTTAESTTNTPDCLSKDNVKYCKGVNSV